MSYKPATVADLLALPDDARHELVGAKLVPKPSRSPKHLRAVTTLGDILGGPYDEDNGWWVFTETLVSMAPRVYRPSLAGWRRERLPNPDPGAPITVVPDWCLDTTTSNHAHDRVRKLDYGINGVKHLWLVDVEAGVVEALELDGQVWRELGVWGVEEPWVRIPPFETIPLELSRIFLPA